MRKLTQRKLEILQTIANKIDSEQYYTFAVEQRRNGIYLVPCEARWFGDIGEYMGDTFEDAKFNIGIFTRNLMG